MKPWRFMVVAGESSGDLLGAELVTALRSVGRGGAVAPCDDKALRLPVNAAPGEHSSFAPRFFGAGGPRLAAAGVRLELDLTAHAVIGLDFLKRYLQFRRIFQRLKALAIREMPDALLLIDFSGFNRRFARAIRRQVRQRTGGFHNWTPKIVQYVSAQVWASRENRARQIARDYDLLLSIFPFEKEWYAQRTPQLRVRFVGHPVIDRYRGHPRRAGERQRPLLLLLPGSRRSEVQRHVPLLVGAMRLIRPRTDLEVRMVLPSEELVALARACGAGSDGVSLQAGGVAESLSQATAAIASTGTVTMECAYFGVPTVAIYVASWSTYQLGKRLIKVPYLAMPNLLAGEVVFPELIQDAATPENIAREAVELLDDATRRITIRTRLEQVIASLGAPGAAQRAAHEIAALLTQNFPG